MKNSIAHALLFPLLLSLLLVFASPAAASSKDDAVNLIQRVQTELNQVQADPVLKPHIPFDTYNDIVLTIISASIQLREKEYDRAYYFGLIASIKLETLRALAEAKMYEFKRYEESTAALRNEGGKSAGKDAKQAKPTIADLNLNPIMKANMQRKGTTFRLELLDKDIFKDRTYKLNAGGEEKLQMVLDALRAYPNSKVKVVGHTRWEDYKKYSKWKARVIYGWLTDNGVDPARADYLGVGNRVVMDTPWGFRRVNRVEIIIYGIELN